MNFGEIVEIPKDRNIILLNTIYHNRTEEDGVGDVITLVFKDLDTGEKIIRDVENPKIEVYVANENVELGNYSHIDIDLKDTKMIDCSYKNLLRDLSKIFNYEQYYYKCLKEKRFDDMKRILEINSIFSADRNIEDFYKFKSKQYFGVKDLTGITKGFYDIETDIEKGYCDLKNGCGEAPINALTFINPQCKESFTLALRDSTNPQIQELENNRDKFDKYIHDLCDEDFGNDYKYNLAFFDDELELIKTFFDLVNYYKLDFMLAWNQSFDISYLIDRTTRLGGSPEEVMCHPDFKYKKVRYIRDTRNFEIKKKSDQVIMSSYSIFIDQMLNYASVRKSQSSIDSYKLDDIGLHETGIGKLSYADVCNHIRDLPKADYFRFIAYNIRDVLTQVKIEEHTKDIIDIAYRAYSYNTRYNKIFKEITFLTDVAFEEFLKSGIVLGNNVNAIKYNRMKNNENVLVSEDEEDGVKFRGAIVGDPKLIVCNGLCLIGKKKSNSLYRFVVDFDFTSLYPTILELFNVYKSTLIGKTIIKGKPNEKEKFLADADFENDTIYDRGSKFIEDYETRESTFIGERHLGLPSITEVFNIFESDYGTDKTKHVIHISKKSKQIKTKKHIIKIKIKKEKECV